MAAIAQPSQTGPYHAAGSVAEKIRIKADHRRGRPMPHDHLPWPEYAIDPSYVPKRGHDLLRALNSKRWRMYSGYLYKIMVKENPDDDDGLILPFKPNAHQTHFFLEQALRKIILKARQLGFTTGIDIEMLDHALWNDNQRCLIIAQSNEDMEQIFRDKVLFAYDNMPRFVRALIPVEKRTERMVKFANNSVIRVALSGRSGTLNRLHVSEFGKISAATPKRAKEVVSGAFPAVVPNGHATIESTAEGKGGEFYRFSERARKRTDDPRPLKAKEWKFMFYPWWRSDDNQVDPEGVTISKDDHDYFNGIEESMGCLLTNARRAWYVLTRDEEFAGDVATMWREHPSTPLEAWQQSREGHYYAKQLQKARVDGHIGYYPPVEGIPCQGVWDIGHTDGTGIWLFQEVMSSYRFVAYVQGWEEPYDYYARKLMSLGLVLGTQYLPHDADNKIMHKEVITTARRMLEELLPNITFATISRIPVKQLQHDLVRKVFPLLRFHQTGHGVEAGIEHLDNYQKTFNTVTATYNDIPLKNDATECADALGIFAQAFEQGAFSIIKPRRKRRAKGGKTL